MAEDPATSTAGSSSPARERVVGSASWASAWSTGALGLVNNASLDTAGDG